MEQNSNETTPESTTSTAPAPTAESETAGTQTTETPEAQEVEAPKRAPRRATSRKPAAKKDDAAKEATDTEAAPSEPAAEEAPKEAPKRATRSRKKATTQADEAKTDATGTTETATTGDAGADTATPVAEDAPAEAPKKPATRRRRSTSQAADKAEAAATDNAETPRDDDAKTETASQDTPAKDDPAEAPAPARGRGRRATSATTKAEASQEATAEEAPKAADTEAAAETETKRAPRTRGRARSQATAETAETTEADDSQQAQRSSRGGRQQAASQDSETTDSGQDSGANGAQSSNGQNGNRQDRDEQQSSRSRTRQRDRKRRGQHNDDLIDPELTEDDVLLPIAGILDVLDNYAFVRTTGYLPGPSDVYVSLGQVKKYNLRKGDAIVGSIRKPSEHDGGSRQKYNAIVKIDTVNGTPLTEDMQRVDFSDLTPLYPQERLRLETAPEKVTQRVIDLIAPIGKGQRGLIVAPPKAGKTIVLQQIANAIAENNPEAHLMVVLVDERPEEVTDMQRTVKGEVIASTFDRPAEDHTTVAELAIERAKRLVELGHDVVVLLDSITRLGRAYNLASPASGRVLTGGVDASALYPPKRFFGAARNIENGGSLTILATALVETGSKADEVIFEEFKGTGNMELRLSRQLADRRIFPAVNLNASSTRREEMLLSPDEVKITWKLRRALGNLSEEQAAELVISKLRETQSNAEFLLLMQKSQGLS